MVGFIGPLTALAIFLPCPKTAAPLPEIKEAALSVADDAAITYLQTLELDPEDDGYRQALTDAQRLAEYIKTVQATLTPKTHARLVDRLIQVGDEMIYWLEWGLAKDPKDWPITWKPKDQLIPIWFGVLGEYLDPEEPIGTLLQSVNGPEWSRLQSDASTIAP